MAARALCASSVLVSGTTPNLTGESSRAVLRGFQASSFAGSRLVVPAAVAGKVKAKTFFMGTSASSATFDGKTLHDFSVKDIDGKDVSLSEYKGKVALIVNVASACGLTQSNYTELTALYDKYKDKGFVVLAFPSNQFGAQEPGSNDQIKNFACSRYKATFPLFSKVDVNGSNADPVFKFLKSQKGGPGFLGEIKWNFGKFLVDKDGKVVERYAPTTSPSSIEEDIKKLL